MRNRRPIFLVGLSRAGTNLVLNLLRSHPEVCSPRGETHEVFRGKPTEPRGARAAKRLRALPIRLLQGRDPFHAGDWTPRRPWHPLTCRTVDRVLFGEKLRARDDSQNRWKRGTPSMPEALTGRSSSPSLSDSTRMGAPGAASSITRIAARIQGPSSLASA